MPTLYECHGVGVFSPLPAQPCTVEVVLDWVTVVQIAAGTCAVWAAWASIPRAPELDWERLFKSALSVFSWARAEAAHRGEGDSATAPSPAQVEAQWRADLVSSIPFHPAGRSWFAKLAEPTPDMLEVPALPGERALVEALARLENPQARWDRLFGEAMLEADLHGAEALGDPRGLGPSYDPSRLLGPNAGWEGVSEWSDAVRAGLCRRLSHVVVLLTDRPAVGDLAAQVEGLRVVERTLSELESPDAVLALMQAPSDRLVWIHGGCGSLSALQLVGRHPALVDRLVGFVCLGRVCRDDIERQHLQDLLGSEALLPELQRRIPLVSVSVVDPTDPIATKASLLRFPPPEQGAADRSGVECIDLGPLPVSKLPPADLGRAVLLTLAFLLDG